MNNQTETKVDSHASSYSFPDSSEESKPNMEGYDPNRIPLSVFTSKPPNHPDWSLASTESLFSITLGRSFESNFLGNYKSSTLYRNMESMDISAIAIDTQIQNESQEIQVNKSFVEASEQTIEPKFFHPNTVTPTQEDVDEKEEEKTSTEESPVLTIRSNIREQQESPVDRGRGSISVHGNEDLIISRFKDRCELPQDRPPHSIEIEIDEDVQPKIVDKEPLELLSEWLSCFHFYCKSLCCGCQKL